MASAARDRLGKTLRGNAEPAFSTERTVRMDALTLDVEGFGRAKFPVTPAKARKLITLGKPARFGRGEDTLTDPEVRDTWEVPVDLVRATWDPGVLRDVTELHQLVYTNNVMIGIDHVGSGISTDSARGPETTGRVRPGWGFAGDPAGRGQE